jgi:hypothetical protein
MEEACMQEQQPWLLALVAVLALAATIVLPRADARPRRVDARARLEAARHAVLTTRIEARRNTVWHWQRLMREPLARYAASVDRSRSLAYDHWVLRLWTRRARWTLLRALHPPHLRAWLCIHRGEAPWTDPNPPYYGGLQMDLEFQRTYGGDLLRRKGTADHWTPLEQMWVAERAFASGRGFSPWPNTAGACGLY